MDPSTFAPTANIYPTSTQPSPREPRRRSPLMIYLSYLPPLMALMFLVISFASGSRKGGYWALRVTMTDGRRVDVGGLGYCVDRGSCVHGLGYRFQDPQLQHILGPLPGLFIYHLFVTLLGTLLLPIHLVHMMWPFAAMTGQWWKVWILWEIPVVMILFWLPIVIADAVVVQGVGRNEAVASVKKCGSFWLPIPAFIFLFIWLTTSIRAWRFFHRRLEFVEDAMLSLKAKIETKGVEKVEGPELGYLAQKEEGGVV